MDESTNYASEPLATDKTAMQKIEEKLAPMSANKRKAGIALVGLGKYSREQLAPALQETEYCYLAGLVTATPAKASEWKMKYDIPDTHIYSYEDFEKISENPDIDIVYITLPNELHAEFVIRAARAGKHVICEKPMAMSVKECDEMIAACKEAGKLLSIGYRLHFDPYHAELMKIGQGKVFGKVKYIHAKHGSDKTTGWRLDKSLAGGGALMDLGIYCLQAACYTSGQDPVAVKVINKKMEDDIETTLEWEMEFPDGATALCETSYDETYDLVHADAEHGWMELAPAFPYEGITGKTATGFMTMRGVNQQALQMDHFACSVLDGVPVALPGEMGRRDLVIIEAIYRSMKSGQREEVGK